MIVSTKIVDYYLYSYKEWQIFKITVSGSYPHFPKNPPVPMPI